jgi:uncharacterized protein YkwD
VTLTRGRITQGRGGLSPQRGRVVLALAVMLACALGGHVRDAPGAGTAYLAPAAACPGSADSAASALAKARVVRCLVNWARAQVRVAPLRPSRELRRAAVLKGRGVAACRELSHAPCRTDVTAAVRQAGYPFASFGENLFAGTAPISAYDVVAAWLQSPPHKANMLRAGFRDLGLAGVPAHGLFGEGTAVVWVAAFGARR